MRWGKHASLDIPGFLLGDSKTRELGQDGFGCLGRGESGDLVDQDFQSKAKDWRMSVFFFLFLYKGLVFSVDSAFCVFDSI